MLAVDRAYAEKECQIDYLKMREKDYQARYEEGYEKGFENGAADTFFRAKAATFDALMGVLDEMGVFDEERETKREQVRTAVHSRGASF